MKKLAISIGDLNGIGLEIALRAHDEVKKHCEPIYCINETMLIWGSALLGIDIPKDFTIHPCGDSFEILPGISTKDAGASSFSSFKQAIKLALEKKVVGVVTLPINKESWSKAGIKFKGHTDALASMIDSETIMMLGCDKLFTILFTHHIPLKDVSKTIKKKALVKFFLDVYNFLHVENIAVLGFNPHAGDNGVIGDEDIKIKKAIKKANKKLDKSVFKGPLVPDVAFTQNNTQNFTYYVCMYHDQGLIPLKTLYFDESINVSLNKSVIRTSVDHGTAFDKAYKDKKPSTVSYINAVIEAIKLSNSH